jgi:hypothetical protein
LILNILLLIGGAYLLWELLTGRLFPGQANYRPSSERREADRLARLEENRWRKMTPQQRLGEQERRSQNELVTGHGCGPVQRRYLLKDDNPEYRRIFSPESPFPLFPIHEGREWTVQDEALLVQAQHIVLHANPTWSSRASKICDVLKDLKRAAYMPGEPVASPPQAQPATGALPEDHESGIKQLARQSGTTSAMNTTVAIEGMASCHPEATAPDGEFLLQLCSRMSHALSIQDERSAYGFMESARCLAGAILDPNDFAGVNRASVFIEADMENGLWEGAIRSGRLFTDAVRQAIQRTNKRN